MPKTQKRDNAYYEERLKNEHPAIYVDFKAGKYPTLMDALIAAGLRKQRTPLHEMINGWNKATPAQRAEFLKFLSAAGVVVPATSSLAGPAFSVAVDRILTPAAKSRIEHIMTVRRMKLGDLMKELGFDPLNASIGYAMKRNTRLQPLLISALETWLSKNTGV